MLRRATFSATTYYAEELSLISTEEKAGISIAAFTLKTTTNENLWMKEGEYSQGKPLNVGSRN